MNFSELEQQPFYFWDTGDQLKNHIYERSRALFAINDELRDAIDSVDVLQERQASLREYFIQSLGGLPDSTTPLNAVTTGVIEEDGFRIEKVVFQSRPHHYVTANLYLPDDLTEPRGAVLFLCGHHVGAKHTGEYQIVCRILVQSGLIVLAQDPIGQGERFSYYEPALEAPAIRPCCPDHDYAGEQCRMIEWGLARFFLHDAMRGVDYLRSRPEVDNSNIGVTGNSGGGTQTSLMMLADPRIAAAAPATFIMNRELYQQVGQAQDAEQVWPGFTSAGYDHEDILLAMAPKPVCVLAVKSDFFPIEATRRTVERCRRMWELSGHSEALELFEDNCIHLYTPTMARVAARFFNQHLNEKEVTLPESNPVPLPEKHLWCTASGQVRAEFEDARIVHDEIVRELSRKQTDETSDKEQALEWLRRKVFSHREACDLNPRFYHTENMDDLCVEMAFWWSQPGLISMGYLFRSLNMDGQDLPVTLALFDDGTRALQQHTDWIRSICAAGRAALVVNISGHGLLEPNAINPYPPHEFYGTLHKFADDLVWMDDSLAALRMYDVLRAFSVLHEWLGLNAQDVQIYASGRMGLYTHLIKALEPSIQVLETNDTAADFRELAARRYYNSHNIKPFVIPGIALRESALL